MVLSRIAAEYGAVTATGPKTNTLLPPLEEVVNAAFVVPNELAEQRGLPPNDAPPKSSVNGTAFAPAGADTVMVYALLVCVTASVMQVLPVMVVAPGLDRAIGLLPAATNPHAVE